MTRVVNISRGEVYDVYIGRRGHGHDGYFGNPYAGEPREVLIRKYREYFAHKIASDTVFRQRILALRGKRLGCFCAPRACHGDVIVAWLNAQPDINGVEL